MSSLLTSLKDRKVIQWTVAYIATAWLIAQVAEGVNVMYIAAEIYARIGDDQKALDLMARQYSMPSVYRGAWWTSPPAFQHLHDNPRFIDLVSKR